MKRKDVFTVICQRRYALILILGLLFAWSGVAWGHGHPEHMTPAPNATLQQAPKQVKMVFTEALEPPFSTLKVTNARGQSVNQGPSQVNHDKPRVMVAPLTALEPGTYTVRWHVVARDGHTTHGEYTFRLK